MAQFIILTTKHGNKKCAVNIENVAEIYEYEGNSVVRYCSGGEDDNLCSVFSETFEEVSSKISRLLS